MSASKRKNTAVGIRDIGFDPRDASTGRGSRAEAVSTLASRLELVRRRKLACLGQAPAARRRRG